MKDKKDKLRKEIEKATKDYLKTGGKIVKIVKKIEQEIPPIPSYKGKATKKSRVKTRQK